jgi:hypothetical protein
MGQMFFYVIELETSTMNYISIFISLPFYCFHIRRYEYILSLYLYALQIEKTLDHICFRVTSASNLYPATLPSVFVFVLKIYKHIWKEPYLIYRFLPLVSTPNLQVGH